MLLEHQQRQGLSSNQQEPIATLNQTKFGELDAVFFTDQRAPVRLILPWPPTVNHQWIYTNRGGKVDKPATKLWRQRAALAIAEQTTASFGHARVQVCLILHPPTLQACDIDNRAKAVLDALEDASVFVNDNQIDMLVIQRGIKIKGGRCHVLVSEFSMSKQST